MAAVRAEGWALCAQTSRWSQSALENYAEEILALVDEQPDWTLDELIVAMRKRRISGSRSALWRFFKRHDIAFKKMPAGSRAKPSGRGPGTPALDARARLA